MHRDKLQIVHRLQLQLMNCFFYRSCLAEGENQKDWGFGPDHQNQWPKDTDNTETNQLQQTINKRQL